MRVSSRPQQKQGGSLRRLFQFQTRCGCGRSRLGGGGLSPLSLCFSLSLMHHLLCLLLLPALPSPTRLPSLLLHEANQREGERRGEWRRRRERKEGERGGEWGRRRERKEGERGGGEASGVWSGESACPSSFTAPSLDIGILFLSPLTITPVSAPSASSFTLIDNTLIAVNINISSISTYTSSTSFLTSSSSFLCSRNPPL